MCAVMLSTASAVGFQTNQSVVFTVVAAAFFYFLLTFRCRDGLMASVKAVHARIDKLVEDGIPSENIVVGGFSQASRGNRTIVGVLV